MPMRTSPPPASTDSLGLLAPLGFDFAVDPANFGAAQTASPTPTPSASPEENPVPPLPTLEDLLEWPYTLENVAWPADDTATASTVEAMGAAGYETVILSSDNVSDPAPTREPRGDHRGRLGRADLRPSPGGDPGQRARTRSKPRSTPSMQASSPSPLRTPEARSSRPSTATGRS